MFSCRKRGGPGHRGPITGETHRDEEQALAAKPTENTEAYDAYLRGLAYTLKTANTTANILNAQKHLREAVRLDPKFALSLALLSYVNARGYRTAFLQPTLALREEAREAAKLLSPCSRGWAKRSSRKGSIIMLA